MTSFSIALRCISIMCGAPCAGGQGLESLPIGLAAHFKEIEIGRTGTQEHATNGIQSWVVHRSGSGLCKVFAHSGGEELLGAEIAVQLYHLEDSRCFMLVDLCGNDWSSFSTQSALAIKRNDTKRVSCLTCDEHAHAMVVLYEPTDCFQETEIRQSSNADDCAATITADLNANYQCEWKGGLSEAMRIENCVSAGCNYLRLDDLIKKSGH